MVKTFSMFGVKIRPHRSLLIFSLCIAFLFIIFFFTFRQNKFSIGKKAIDQDDDIDISLIDLFNNAFQLTYEAGQTIKLFKNQNKTFFKKKSFQNLESEPVTIADLLSHSILTNGLKQKFSNLQIISEEKDPMNSKEFRFLKKQFSISNKQINIPFIHDQEQFLTVPLSSVAVWIDPLDATKEFTENLLEYVTVMLCVTVENQPTIGIVYAPFTNKITWGWVGVDRSMIKRDENLLSNSHQENVDEIILSRSHAGKAHEILKTIYSNKQYKIIPAAGAGYKTVQILEEYADYYLHITPIKKWDICASDAILRANHGLITTLNNQTIDYDHQKKEFLIKDGILATYKRNHQQILNFLTDANLTKYLNQGKT